MIRVEEWVVASLAIVLIAAGPNSSVAGDGPERTGDEINLSLSLGIDRPLELMCASVKLSSNGRRAVATTWFSDRGLYVWDAETGRRLLHVPGDTLKHHVTNADIDELGCRFVTGGSFDVVFSPDLMRASRYLLGGIADAWDAGSGRLARTFVLHDRLDQRRGQYAFISRNGARAAGVDASLNVKLWDAETGRELASVDGAIPPGFWPGFCSFSDDLRRFATLLTGKGDGRRSIYLCDLFAKTTRIIDSLPGEKSQYGRVAVCGDGREVAAWVSGAPGRELAIFDFETGALRTRLRGPECEHNCCMAFGPDARAITLGKDDGRLDVVDRRSGARVELRVSDGPVRAVAFLPNRGRVRVVTERKSFLKQTPNGGAWVWAGPMKIADYAVRFPSPSP